MLSTTQLLIFELGSTCNLGHLHSKCPNSVRVPDTLLAITDDLILDLIDEAYVVHNFTGLIGWHYYNEPMLQYERMFSLMEKRPDARYILWTNGTIHMDDPRISKFEIVHNSNYNFGRRVRFDSRLQDTCNFPVDDKVCLRQHIEFIIDNWGTAHLCCQDWRGEIQLGNIWRDSFSRILNNRIEILESMRVGKYPYRCGRCKEKMASLPRFDRETYERTLKYV